jgi:hypothetical protein
MESDAMKFRPLHDRVLVKRVEDTKDLPKEDEDQLHQAVKEWKTTATY